MSKKSLSPKNNVLTQHGLLIGVSCGLIMWWFIQSLYFWQPPGFTSDEAALGNYGVVNQWWLSDSPIYSLALTGLLTFLPQTVETLRLPALLSGLFLPLFIGLLSFELFRNLKAAVFAGVLSLLAPWTIQLSQAAFPQLLSVCLGLLGLVWMLREKFYIGWGFCLLGSLSHPASAFFLPLLAILFIWREKKLFSSVGLGWLVMIVTIGLVYHDQLFNFYVAEAFYQEVGFVNRINELRGYVHGSVFEPLAPVLFNKLTWGAKIMVDNWLAPWDWYWWFHHSRYPQSLLVDQLGKFYFIDFLLFVIGFCGIYKIGLGKTSVNESVKNSLWLLIVWLAISSLPGVLHEQANLNETFFWIIPVWFVIVGYGLERVLQFGNKGNVALVIVVFLYISGLTTFSNFYELVFPKLAAKQWHFGYLQVVEELRKFPKQNSLVITDRLGGDPTEQLRYLDPIMMKNTQLTLRSLSIEDIVPEEATTYVTVPQEAPDSVIACTNNDACTMEHSVVQYPDGSIAAYIFIWK